MHIIFLPWILSKLFNIYYYNIISGYNNIKHNNIR